MDNAPGVTNPPTLPFWVRRIHALGIHGRPLTGCTLCVALVLEQSKAQALEDDRYAQPADN